MQSSQVNMRSDTGLKDYSIERLTAERLKDVEQLYKEVYGREAPMNYFRIKYDTAYTGHEYMGFVAYNNERIPVAYYGVIPCFLQCGNEKIIAAQSADTMTHPKFRYKGMFVELSNITFDLCRQAGIRLIFGFPNQNSYHGAVHKLGWKLTHTMECFIIPVSALPLARLTAKTKLTKSIYHQYRQRILNKYLMQEKLISNSVIRGGYCGVLRDTNYERSKSYHARLVLKLENATLWCKISSEWVLGDLQVASEDFESAIKKIKDMARKLGVQQIQFHTSPDTQLHSLFAAHFKSIPSFPALFQQFDSSVDISRIKFTLADIDIF